MRAEASRRAVVTGANRGLGRALAVELLTADPQIAVGLGTRSATPAPGLEPLTERFGSRCLPLWIDHDDEGSVVAAAAHVAEQFGHLDLLINCAAANVAPGEKPGASRGPLPATTATAFETLFRTNVVGPLLLCREFLPLLSRSTAPVVVNLSSSRASMSLVEDAESVAYAVTKSALNMLTRKLSLDPALASIVVVALDPGWVRTDMGGARAPSSASEAARDIVGTIAGLEARRTGEFMDRRGIGLPW